MLEMSTAKPEIRMGDEVHDEPVRVLHFLPSLSADAGQFRVVLNYHRHIDPSRVRFDYLY